MAVDLIYCADGNRRFAEIAIEHGFKYGAQLPPRGLHFPPWFCDQDWQNPDREIYMTGLAKYRPHMASVLDWERLEQLPEVLAWAEEAAQYIEVVMIIPKVIGGVPRIPDTIGGKPVRLGYSVPTKFGGTALNYWEFGNRPVHVLGGSPHKQRRLTGFLNVVSIDGNMHHKMATRICAFWDPTKKISSRGYWPTIQEYDGRVWGDGSATADAPYEAFRRSCENIIKMWRGN